MTAPSSPSDHERHTMLVSRVARALAIAIAIAPLAGCAATTDDGGDDAPLGLSDQGVGIQRDDDTWTTTGVCKACGCTVSGFQCNCGLNPRPDKLECIKNGGPVKAYSFSYSAAP